MTKGTATEDVDQIAAQGAAAWPDVHVPRHAFVAFIEERLPDGGRRGELHAADLYLVCGCLRGDAGALAAIESLCFPEIDRALSRMNLGARADDIKQNVRQRLFVAAPGVPPKLAAYRGRGRLAAWLRVIAVREALDQIDKVRREVAVDPDHLAHLPIADDDPELDHIQRNYRAGFREAFEAAFGALSARDQNLLRQHLIDRLTVTQLGALYRVHYATAARWVIDAREALLAHTRKVLTKQLRLTDSECDSVIRAADSKLELSISRIFRRE